MAGTWTSYTGQFAYNIEKLQSTNEGITLDNSPNHTTLCTWYNKHTIYVNTIYKVDDINRREMIEEVANTYLFLPSMRTRRERRELSPEISSIWLS